MFGIDHYAISVCDMEKSISFYQKFEFEVIKDFNAEDGSVRIVQMKKDNFILEMFGYPDCEPVPAFVENLGADLKVNGAKHLGLCVADVEKAAQYLKEQGIVDEIPAINEGRLGRPYFFIKDPNGIFVEIISR